jgi:6-phosphogluconolactonase
MDQILEVFATEAEVAETGAQLIAVLLRQLVAEQGSVTLAVSGGRTPWLMFERLAELELPWEEVTIFQVDERIAPAGDPARNLVHLRAALASVPARIVAMEVEDPDPEAAAARYAELLPDSLDLVHLGLGPDGHTASLVPDDAVLEISDRLVALTRGEYQGCRRMTLTYPTLARAGRVIFVVTGEEKREALAKLLARDPRIPAGRLETASATILADAGAAGRR